MARLNRRAAVRMATAIGATLFTSSSASASGTTLVRSVADVTKFGAKSTADKPSPERRAANRRAIQAAVDSLQKKGGIVYFPPGVHPTDAAIQFDSYVTFQGANVGSSIVDSNVAIGAVFAKRGLPADLTRAYHVFFRDLQITNTSSNKYTKQNSTNKSIGIDFTNVSQSGIHTVKIEYVNIGILIEGKRESLSAELKAAHYLDLYSPLISTIYIGIKCRGHNDPVGNDPGGGSANETHVFGGRVADATTGIELNDVNNFQVQSTAIEGCDTGMDLQERAAGTKIVGCRFEPKDDPTESKGTQGIRINRSASRTLILGAYFENRMQYPIHDYAPEQETTIIATNAKRVRG